MLSVMNSLSSRDEAGTEQNRGLVIARQFGDELTGASTLETLTKRAQEESDEEFEKDEHLRLRLLYEGPTDQMISPQDFDVAEIARLELEKVIQRFKEETKPTVLQKLGFSGKSTKTNSIEALENAAQRDTNDLREFLDGMEDKWIKAHGPVYTTFKRIAGTLDAHKSILRIFPTQSTYASVLSGSLTCLAKAAKNHSDIADLLAKSVATISDTVATCSDAILIIKTPRVRKRLADVYARMFQFYQSAMEWYLRSKLSRALTSFNENFKKSFDDAVTDINNSISELYREVSLGSMAMVAMMHGNVSRLEKEYRRQRRDYEARDTLAGHRMQQMLQATWMENQYLRWKASSGQPDSVTAETFSPKQISTTIDSFTRAKARECVPPLEPFINGEEGPALFGSGGMWLAEDEVISKLRDWMVEKTSSRTLWISSPYEPGIAMTGARAAALSTLAAAWQAETPIISYFCKRPEPHHDNDNLSIEQMGMIGLVYSLIKQLLQFKESDDILDVSEREFEALNGSMNSWEPSLDILRALLGHIPVVMFCVIDGLNEFTWGDGEHMCQQFLDVLSGEQKQGGGIFNMLLTTAGQSLVLPSYIRLEDRHITTRKARELIKSGRRIDLTAAEC